MRIEEKSGDHYRQLSIWPVNGRKESVAVFQAIDGQSQKYLKPVIQLHPRTSMSPEIALAFMGAIQKAIEVCDMWAAREGQEVE